MVSSLTVSSLTGQLMPERSGAVLAGARNGEGRLLRLLLGAGLALYLLALLGGAVIEPPQLARESGSLLVHGGAFAGAQVFVFLLSPRWRTRLLWLLLLFLFGMGIEAVQHFLPWRSATWIDLCYNGLGLGVGFAACALLERFGQWCGWLPLSAARRSG